MSNIIFSFIFNKYCSIVDYLDLKNSSRKLQINYIISYYFYLYLMLHIVRFDVMNNLNFFKKIFWKLKQGLTVKH